MRLSTGVGKHRLTVLSLTAVMGVAITLMLALAWPVSGQNTDEGAPAQPTGLTGAVSSEAVSLSWGDPGDSSITGYQVRRPNPAVDETGVFHTIADDTGSADNSYTDSTVAGETRYFYRVRARNSSGLSPMSGFFRANVPASDPDGTRADAIDLGDITDQDGVIFRRDSVDGVHDEVDYYKFTLTVTREVGLGLRKQDANGDLFLEEYDGEQLFSSESGGNGDEWILENLSAGTYYIRVEAQETGTNQQGLRYGVKPAVAEQQATPANSAASGQPTITGTAQVGETLTADTSGISDGNGLTYPQYTYQWIRTSGGTDTDIAGASGSTYILTTDELAHTLKVRVNFTDDDGYSETLTSSATGAVSQPPNQPATGQPTITGTAQVGETLTADTSGITDGNGLSNPQYAYQWIGTSGGTDTDISGATGSTYALTTSELAHTIKVRVSFTDDDGYSETLTSNATGTVNRPPNQTASGQPTITGTVKVGETLTADTSGISDGNGLSTPQYTYQWLHSVDGTDTDISGATESSYVITSDDAGKSFKFRVSFADDDGHSETLTSAATDTLLVTQQQSEADTRLDCIEWFNLSGGRIQISAMGWTNGPPVYDRLIPLSTGAEYVTINPKPYATSGVTVTFDLADAKPGQDGHQMHLPGAGPNNLNVIVVTVTDDESPSNKSVYTLSVRRPEPERDPEFVDGAGTTRQVEENLSDGASVGQPLEANDPNPENVLTFSIEGPHNPNFSINSRTGQLKTRTTFNYESKSSYSLTAVVEDDTGRSDEIDVAIEIVNVDEPGRVNVSPRELVVGDQARAGLNDPDGGITGRTWQWQRCDANQSNCLDITGATSSTYTPVAADGGKYLQAVASYTDNQGSGKSAEGSSGKVASVVTTLSSLTVSGITLDFHASDRWYDGQVPNSVTSVTVAGTPTATTGATVRIMPADGDQSASGHQVNLNASGITSIIILVQADDGSGSTAYYVDVTRGN